MLSCWQASWQGLFVLLYTLDLVWASMSRKSFVELYLLDLSLIAASGALRCKCDQAHHYVNRLLCTKQTLALLALNGLISLKFHVAIKPYLQMDILHCCYSFQPCILVSNTEKMILNAEKWFPILKKNKWAGAIVGLMLVLLYGREGWFAPALRATGFNVVFAFPGRYLRQSPEILTQIVRLD